MTVETLAAYGMERMDDEAVRTFLGNQRVGVLGLPTADVPYLVPMSYGYDGEASLYFLFIGNSASEKAELAAEEPEATFLTYSAETMFNWRSVTVTGTLSAVAADQREAIEGEIDIPWRPELFKRALEDEHTALYQLTVGEWVGVKHTGLPAGFHKAAAGEAD
jgi:nitroimidazol reductase NimA-like FMN-containing flavoprotein (pyridoxamine 5'-phosphate oxidase superfamily)